jgi:hypothetical protein
MSGDLDLRQSKCFVRSFNPRGPSPEWKFEEATDQSDVPIMVARTRPIKFGEVIGQPKLD